MFTVYHFIEKVCWPLSCVCVCVCVCVRDPACRTQGLTHASALSPSPDLCLRVKFCVCLLFWWGRDGLTFCASLNPLMKVAFPSWTEGQLWRCECYFRQGCVSEQFPLWLISQSAVCKGRLSRLLRQFDFVTVLFESRYGPECECHLKEESSEWVSGGREA
jgi:hypothetical protein